MGDVVREVLPLALGIAVSPIPVIAAILMLLSPKARTTSVGFVVGWLVGIVVALGSFIALASVLPAQDSDDTAPITGWIRIVLGALMVLLAVKQWRSRPVTGAEAHLPKWMSAIDSMNVGKAAAVGFLLSAVNPKNLLMAAGAGVTIGSAALSGSEVATVFAIFVAVAGCSVALPVVVFLVASRAVASSLDTLRAWLVQHNAVVMTALLLVIGFVLIGKGSGSL